MYAEDELLLISALQHLAFCERQWALIHLEQVWVENLLTAEGRSLHQRTHNAEVESRPGLQIARGLRIRSLRLGLVGQADVVEFHQAQAGAVLPGAEGLWRPLPVEYKRGRSKIDDCDRIQLCAQALCLEEMLATDVPQGAIFYGRPRRREQVQFHQILRQKTETLARRLHSLQKEGRTPKARYQKKCRSCSLFEQCRPKVTGLKKDIEHYLAKARED